MCWLRMRPGKLQEMTMKIVLEDLTLQRPGNIAAIQGLSCTFEHQATALLGANGAGKSSLLESILGLVPIQGGAIYVDDISVEKRHLTRIRAKVGMVFQNSDDQLFSHTVAEDVAFGPQNLQLSSAEVEQRVQEAMTLLNVSHLARRDVSQLSGGEKRRVALAGVLAMRPEAILLDEPTSMLDPRTSRELAEHLRSIDALLIIATHDLHFARRVCPQTVLLNRGRLVASGDTDAILENHALLMDCGLE